MSDGAELWRRRARIAGRFALVSLGLSITAVVLSVGCLLDWWAS
jgi:hypothetical protein